MTGIYPTYGVRACMADYMLPCMPCMQVANICCNGRIVSVLEGGYGELQFKDKAWRYERGQPLHTARARALALNCIGGRVSRAWLLCWLRSHCMWLRAVDGAGRAAGAQRHSACARSDRQAQMI